MITNRTLSYFARLALLTAGVFIIPPATAREAMTEGFSASPSREYVEVNLDRNLIALARDIVATSEPDLAALLAEIERISVRVVGLDDTNRETSLQRIETIRTELKSEGWASIVTFREGSGGDNVSILARVTGETINGVVITVIDSDDEVVVLDIDGRVTTEQLAQLVEGLRIQGLDDLSPLLQEA
jgi:hypothetical protein